MRRLSSLLLALGLALGVAITPLQVTTAAADESLFTQLEGFATKTGFRGVFAWSASQPVTGIVHYGTDPDHLDNETGPLPGLADTSQLAVADGLAVGSTVYWQVEDTVSGETSAVQSFKAANAYTSWDGAQYTINLLVQLDSQSLPEDIPSDLAIADIAAGMNIFAERLYDATDHYVRLGKVLVTDTNLDYAANIPNTPSIALNACAPQATEVGPNLADVIVQTSQPFDSHTYSGFAINSPCISFYVGRIGQLVIPWESDLHLGYISTHEMAHYALNAPDLYPIGQTELPADPQCNKPTSGPDYDVSVMNNTGGWQGTRWRLTEFERSAALTPCDMGSPEEPYTWTAMRARYTNIPSAAAAGLPKHIVDDQARGNPDGGALAITTLDREPGASVLSPFTPFDGGGVVCTNLSPVIVDPEDDANQVLGTGTPAPSEPNLDVTKTFLTYDEAADAVTFHIDVKDLTDTHANGSQGEIYELFFSNGAQQHYLDISRSDLSGEVFSLYDANNGARGTTKWLDLTGTFDNATDQITAVLPLAAYNAQLATRLEPDPPVFASGSVLKDFSLTTRKDAVAVVPDADSALGQCTYAVGQELAGPSGPPVAVPDTATTVENNAVLVDVLGNDTDPDGDVIALSAVDSPSHGAASVLGEQVLYNPSPGYNGPDAFTYTVIDATGATAVGSVSVTVTPGPRAPVAVSDEATTGATGGTVTVLGNDSDANGDALSVAAVTNGFHGTVTTDGTTVTYHPTTGWNSDRFTYTVSDGGLTTVGTVVVVNGACASTVEQNLAAAGLPAGWATELAQGTHSPAWAVRPDALTHSGTYAFHSSAESSEIKDDRLVSPPFQVTDVTTLSFWHRYAFENGFDGGVLEVTTDGGTTWHDVLTVGGVFVAGGYEDGVIGADSTSPLSGRPAWTGSSFVDADTQVFVDLSALAGRLAKVRWRLATDDIVPGVGVPGWWVDDVTIGRTAALGCASGPTNTPVAVADTAVTATRHTATVDVLANDTDPDQSPLQIQSVGAAAHGTTGIAGGKVTYKAAPGYSGPDSFTYVVTDGLLSATGTVAVTVRPGPVAIGDINGDGRTELTTFRPATSEWWSRNFAGVVWGGQSGDVPLFTDLNGDRKAEHALYRPSTGEWLVRGRPNVVLGGRLGDVPVPADYDGDGDEDVAVFRSSTGEWLTLGQPSVRLGRPGDIAVPGDYDGDGDVDRAVWHPADGTWQIGATQVAWGAYGDRPVPADYDGDGVTDLAVFQPNSNGWMVKTATSSYVVGWGTQGDLPVPADFNGDGKAEIATYRPSGHTWFFYDNRNAIGWGWTGDVVVVVPAAQRRGTDGRL